jgi:hypothetical protein
MNKELLIPIIWEDWDALDTDVVGFYDVIFYEDFGIFKKDDKYPLVCINYEKGIVTAKTTVNTRLTQKFKATPII